MKKLLIVTLAVLVALALVACGGSSGDGGDGVPGNDTTVNNPPAKTPDNSGGNDPGSSGDTGTSDDGNSGNTGADISIPNNGTPPNVPVPFESHPGDIGYFYVDTDDYFVFMYDIEFDMRNPAYAFAPAVMYTVISFDDRDFTEFGRKWVFESETNAAGFANEDPSYVAIENVVYIDYSIAMKPMFEAFGKETHVRIFYTNAVWAHGGNAHLSKPAGFEELLADNTMKGKTGYMTVREAFSYAGFNTLPDITDFDYDSVTNFTLRFNRDNSFAGFDADLIILDGDTELLYPTFFFFDDTSKEANYRLRDYLPGWDRVSHMDGVLATRRGGSLAYMGLE